MVDAALIEEVEGPAGSPEDNKERDPTGDLEVVFAMTLPCFGAVCLRLRS